MKTLPVFLWVDLDSGFFKEFISQMLKMSFLLGLGKVKDAEIVFSREISDQRVLTGESWFEKRVTKTAGEIVDQGSTEEVDTQIEEESV